MTENNPTSRERFIHRELSWLQFNRRVLEEAMDKKNPLMERMKFLAIFFGNLDEFLMVRVAGLKNLIDSGIKRKDRFGYYPQEILVEVKEHMNAAVDEAYTWYTRKALKELNKEGIFIREYEDLSRDQKRQVHEYFETTLFPIITPLGVDPGHPFPVLPSKSLAIAVILHRDEEDHMAILPVPKNVRRLYDVSAPKGGNEFVLVEEIIRQYLHVFFRGYTVKDRVVFRVIRDSELSIEEEYTPDLLKALEEQVTRRRTAKVVALQVAGNCSPELREALCEGLAFPGDQVQLIESHMDLTYLFELYKTADAPSLCDPGLVPAKVPYDNIFDRIREGDFLVHLPFQSFYPTADLISTAADDPHVLAIKMTLYRTNDGSRIIEALKRAAKNGKQVTTLIEIQARFDEEQNINWVRELEKAGCHVMYGIPGLKIHSKMSLIVREEEGKIRRYVHLSTGNYNEDTARVYTDFGYFTSNEDIARDISEVFNVITGFSVPTPWKRVISSPHNLRNYFVSLIDREIACQKQYKNGMIRVKINSLEDPKIVDKLYQASRAGVRIQLMVRGICCLVPGRKGLSSNIEVRSIVGRFLEHTRLFIFNNNNKPRVFLASSDWMRRNLDRRIELMFEINNEKIKTDLLDIMDIYWKDNVKSRVLKPDRSYVRNEDGRRSFNTQEYLAHAYGRKEE